MRREPQKAATDPLTTVIGRLKTQKLHAIIAARRLVGRSLLIDTSFLDIMSSFYSVNAKVKSSLISYQNLG